MDKIFLKRIEDIKFHYDSNLKGYFLIPDKDLRITHNTITFNGAKKFYRVYEKLLAMLGKFWDMVIIKDTYLDTKGIQHRRFYVIGDFKALPAFMDYFNKLHTQIEAIVQRKKISNRIKSQKGATLTHFGHIASLIRKEYVEYTNIIILRLLEDKQTIPYEHYKSIKHKAILDYIKYTIPIRGLKHRVYATKPNTPVKGQGRKH